jgi:hypothetical protein
MSRGAQLVLLLLPTAACGDNITPVHGVQSGSRLEARYWDAGDNARAFQTWFDRQLGTECHFDLATDGRFRCLPLESSDVSFRAFADAACTQPVFAVPDCARVPAFVRGATRVAFCGRLEAVPVHAVGGARTTRTYFDLDGDTCVMRTAREDQVVYDLRPEQAPTDFVAADLVVEAPEQRLSPYTLVAEDGSRLVDGIWDTRRDGECGGGVIGVIGGVGFDARCRPEEIALHYDFLFSDATCSVHAALDLSDERACNPPTAVWIELNKFLEIGAQLPTADVHRMEKTGACAVQTPLEGYTYWLEGAPIPDTDFAPLAEVHEGSGRVVVKRWSDTDGHALDAARENDFFDTSHDTNCYWRRFADGYRCAVGAPTWDRTFADARCRTPAVVWNETPPIVVYSRHRQTGACDHVEFDRTYAVGAAVAGATSYYYDSDTGCVALPLSPGGALYLRGDEVEDPPRAR